MNRMVRDCDTVVVDTICEAYELHMFSSGSKLVTKEVQAREAAGATLVRVFGLCRGMPRAECCGRNALCRSASLTRARTTVSL